MSLVFRNAAIYVVAGFLPVAANFFLAPVYTQFMSPSEYALVGLATLFQAFLTFFISLSLDSAFGRLYFKYESDPAARKGLITTLLLAILITTLTVGCLLGIFGNGLFSTLFSNDAFSFSEFGYWIILTTCANVILLFFAALYRNEEKVKKFVSLNLSFFFIPVAFSLIGLIVFDGGAQGTIAGRAIGSGLVIFIVLTQYFAGHKITFKKSYLQEALKYSLPLLPYQLMFAAFANLDRIILQRIFTPHDFGVYNLAVMISGLIPVFINAVSSAVNPGIYRTLTQNKNLASVKEININVLLGTMMVIFSAMSVVVPFMRIFINAEYADSYPYIGTLFLVYLPYIHYLVYSIPFFYNGNTRPFPIISFMALIAGIISNVILIRFLGLWSVCLSLYVIRLVQLAGARLFLRRYNMHELEYIEQRLPLTISLVVITVYNLLLFTNLQLDLMAIDFLNMVPVVVFSILVLLFYRNKITAFKLSLLAAYTRLKPGGKS